MPLELRFLPAAEGDAIWVRWGDGLEHQMMVDMGQESSGSAIRSRFEALPEAGRHFELLVITHVDGDHVGGVLTGLAEATPLEGLKFDDIWFNGWAHLHGRTVPRPGSGTGLESMGGAQGQRLTQWLTGPWNEAFNRGPVAREDPLRVVTLSDDLRITILGPTTGRLQALQATWEEEVELAIEKGQLPGSSGLEALGRRKPERPELLTKTDLRFLADEDSTPDPSPSNATSITLLMEWRRRRVLLTGDAFGADIVDGLGLLGPPSPVPIDIFKLPHHGSERNVTSGLVKAVRCRDWVFSTNGAKHFHPDAVAVARVLVNASRPRLLFNVPSEFNRWWSDDDAWRTAFGYKTKTGTKEAGLTVTLKPRTTPAPPTFTPR